MNVLTAIPFVVEVVAAPYQTDGQALKFPYPIYFRLMRNVLRRKSELTHLPCPFLRNSNFQCFPLFR
jgi:hypothetical protein